MSDSYDSIFSDFWRWRLAESPYYACLCADSSQKGRINAWTLEGREKSLAIGRQLTNRLAKLRKDDKNEHSLDIETLLHELKTYVEGMESASFFFPIGIFDNPTSAVNRMFLTMNLETRDDLDAAASCAKAVPEALEQTIAVLRVGANKGITLFRGILDLMVKNLIVHRDCPPESFLWLHTLRRKLVKVDENANGLVSEAGVMLEEAEDEIVGKLNKEEIEVFLKSIVKIVEEKIQPAISGLVDFLKDFYIPKCRPEISISSVPKQSKEELDLYSHCLRFHIDLPMTPKEVHDLGWKEVERIEREIQVTQ